MELMNPLRLRHIRHSCFARGSTHCCARTVHKVGGKKHTSSWESMTGVAWSQSPSMQKRDDFGPHRPVDFLVFTISSGCGLGMLIGCCGLDHSTKFLQSGSNSLKLNS
jgi:hypothetical protein